MTFPKGMKESPPLSFSSLPGHLFFLPAPSILFHPRTAMPALLAGPPPGPFLSYVYDPKRLLLVQREEELDHRARTRRVSRPFARYSRCAKTIGSNDERREAGHRFVGTGRASRDTRRRANYNLPRLIPNLVSAISMYKLHCRRGVDWI